MDSGVLTVEGLEFDCFLSQLDSSEPSSSLSIPGHSSMGGPLIKPCRCARYRFCFFFNLICSCNHACILYVHMCYLVLLLLFVMHVSKIEVRECFWACVRLDTLSEE